MEDSYSAGKTPATLTGIIKKVPQEVLGMLSSGEEAMVNLGISLLQEFVPIELIEMVLAECINSHMTFDKVGDGFIARGRRGLYEQLSGAYKTTYTQEDFTLKMFNDCIQFVFNKHK